MKTRNIFIDTQAFMQEGFRFESNVLARIYELGRDQMINIYISEVIRGEVISKIEENMIKTLTCCKRLSERLKILENNAPKELKNALENISDEYLKEIGFSRWYEYIKKSNIQVLDPNKVCNNELLTYYFSGKPPFSAGKKKNEFPDAISMLCLKSWLEENNEHVYVISNDKDLKNFCAKEEQCISLDRLSDFLDIYNRAENRLTDIVHECVENEIDQVTKVIKESFLGCGFIYDGYLDEASVDEVIVKTFDTKKIKIIKVKEGQAVIELSVAVVFDALISGADYEHSIWDQEDKTYLYLNHFSDYIEFNECYDVSIKVYFNEEKKKLTKTSDILFNGGNDIELRDNDGLWYD